MPRSPIVVLFAAGMVLTACGIIWLGAVKPWLAPEQILQRFYSEAAAEDMLMDPLILGGKKVVPLVIREIQRRDMPRRRYAIGFLGNGDYDEAIPMLEEIVKDNAEQDYVRGDALRAIYQIDASLGSNRAELYVKRQDHLGEMARHIMMASFVATDRRSYVQALLGKH